MSYRTSPVINLWKTYVWPRKLVLLGIVCTVTLQTWTVVSIPQLLARFVVLLEQNGVSSASQSTLLAAQLALVTLTGVALGIASSHITTRLAWKATNALREDLVLKCCEPRLPLENIGRAMEMIEGDTEQLGRLLSGYVVEVLSAITVIVWSLAILTSKHPGLGLALCTVAMIACAILILLRKLAVVEMRDHRAATASYYGLVEQVVSGRREWRRLWVADHLLTWITERAERVRTTGVQAYFRSRMVWPATIGLFGIAHVIVFGIGIYSAANGSATVAVVFLAFQYTEVLRKPIETLAGHTIEYQGFRACATRIADLLDTRIALVAIQYYRGTGEIVLSLDGVSVTYPDGRTAGPPVSHDFRRGSLTAIIGRTGSGKSTIGRTIAGSVAPTGGTLTCYEIGSPAVRPKIAYVDQSPPIFSATVRDNLTLWRDVPDAEIWKACDKVGIGEFVRGLDGQLDAMMTRESLSSAPHVVVFVSLARIVLSGATIVVLDEPGAVLTQERMNVLARLLVELKCTMALVVITHRHELIELGDSVIDLDKPSPSFLDESPSSSEIMRHVNEA